MNDDTLIDFTEHVKGFLSKNLTQLQLRSNMWLGWRCESGELGDVLKKHFYHADPLDKTKLRLEAGDVLFYIFGTFIVERNYNLFIPEDSDIAFSRSVKESEIERVFDDMDVIYLRVKSLIRYSPATPDQINGQVQQLMCDYLNRLRYLIYPITLEEAMEGNKAKLRERHNGTEFNAEQARKHKAASIAYEFDDLFLIATKPFFGDEAS